MQIIILPGLDGTGTLVPDVTDILSEVHPVTPIAYPAKLSSYDDLLSIVNSTLPQDDFIIIAESFSGPLAVMIAAQNPAGLRGLCFVATFAKTPRKFPSFITSVLQILPLTSSVCSWMSQPILMGKWRSAAFLGRYQEAIDRVPVKTIAERLNAVRTVDVVGLLEDIRVPMLYLQATSDWLVPDKSAQDFAQAHSTVAKIAGPHFLLQANPPEAARHIQRFIDNLG